MTAVTEPAGMSGPAKSTPYWLRVLTEIRNRGFADVCIVVCDGLKGLPDAIATAWPQAITWTCIVHLLRNSFKYASKKGWAAVARDLKPVYTVASEAAALDAFAEHRRAAGGQGDGGHDPPAARR